MRRVRLLILFIPLFLLEVYYLNFRSKIYPNIEIAGVNVGGLNISEASNALTENVNVPEEIRLVNQTQEFTLNLKDVGFYYDFRGSAERAYNLVRSGNIFYDSLLRLNLLTKPVNMGLITKFDEERLSKFISIISGQDSIEPVGPKINILGGKITVSKGKPGIEVDQALLRAVIGNNLAYLSDKDIQIPVTNIDNTITAFQAIDAKVRAERLLGKSLTVKFEAQAGIFNSFKFSDRDTIKLLNPKGGYDESEVLKAIAKISSQIERPPQNPKFDFNNGRVIEFLPAKDGVTIKIQEFKETLVASLDNLAANEQKTMTLEPQVTLTPAAVTTEKVNNLGIKELIGRGTSTFYHSILSRVHNVVLAASRINGTLVAPGESFSFNETLGDVSQFTGYQQAYIISGGKTILGDGGGVCQVSTTLFRAILNAGLPVLERTAHAYRVGYYEQNSPPGLDATVYGPTPDLKFTNDTPSYILIEAHADPKRYSLIFELYGTGDGRVATISKPIVSNVVPALATIYQDDPTLPTGTVKQVDFSAAGATVTFKYSVTRAGEAVFQKTFVSNYRPWAAVYLKGTDQ